MKAQFHALLPAPVWHRLSQAKRALIRSLVKTFVLRNQWIGRYFTAWELSHYGLSVARADDYYSPLPVLPTLRGNQQRWFKPSQLIGVHWDLEEMKTVLTSLLAKYGEEYSTLPSYEENRTKGYGQGFTPVDAMVLFLLVREIQPRRYLEVGAGLSTYYSALAGKRNLEAGKPVRITCIDPHAAELLGAIEGAEILKQEVQDVPFSVFEELDAGDILFIDSTHTVKLDGDVPFLHLEVLPRLNKGVIVHVHDIPFPYNVPYPPSTWIFERDWPVFWTEAMLVQALLCETSAFRIRLSLPLLRYFDESFLRARIPNYDGLQLGPYDTFSSLWLEKVK